MTPVFQTENGREGNCFEACLASLLDLPLAHVPRFPNEPWDDAVCRWGQERGIAIEFHPPRLPPEGNAILIQRMPDTTHHAVICQDGRIVHDPSPRPLARPEYPIAYWATVRTL